VEGNGASAYVVERSVVLFCFSSVNKFARSSMACSNVDTEPYIVYRQGTGCHDNIQQERTDPHVRTASSRPTSALNLPSPSIASFGATRPSAVSCRAERRETILSRVCIVSTHVATSWSCNVFSKEWLACQDFPLPAATFSPIAPPIRPAITINFHGMTMVM